MPLFTRLYALASRQDENFTTESLAVVLEHLLAFDPAAGVMLAEYLSAGAIKATETEPGSISTTTRPPLERGIPDIVLSTGNSLAYVEAKVEAGLGPDQLKRYREDLEASGAAKTSLVTLSRYPMGDLEVEPDRRLHWIEVGQWLSKLLDDTGLSQPSRFLVHDYLHFLQERGLALHPPRSDMSRSLSAYLTEHSEDSVFMGSSIRSLAGLEEIPALHPFIALLGVLREALRRTLRGSQIKLWSAASSSGGPGWIGYNIDSMAYYACVYLNRPDILVFETYKAGINPRLAEAIGEPVFTNDGMICWKNTLDLADQDAGFYSMELAAQIDYLHRFLSAAIALAKKMAA